MNIPPTSTEGREFTSNTSPGSCAGSPTPGSVVSERHGRRRASRPTGCPAAWRRPTPRSRCSGSTWRWPPGCEGADLVHSHTWYANFAGHVAKMLYGTPHVVTTHSLEPLRPWKAEQLGGGYTLSSWAERGALATADAIIAVSEGMRRDVLASYPEISPERVTVIHNGIDTGEYAPDRDTDVLERHGIDPSRPYVVFVGRITRQKGLVHLLHAARDFHPDAQLVLCAGAPDTPEIAAEVTALVRGLDREGVVWISEMLPRPEVIQILTHATVFVCPSVYEPMGIVNLEAMACETAVVATATGGIPEVVADGSTGLLVPIEQAADGTPHDPDAFAAGLAGRVNRLLADPALATRMGEAGRIRAVEHFSWERIAERTMDLYRRVAAGEAPVS
ncbi:glycogen synthase [Streptosporangium vulgare]|uniref:glycogen synthase n=1 Tax=Streptosporangium vulgare TaxID=46190 RepID=UPI0031D0B7BB